MGFFWKKKKKADDSELAAAIAAATYAQGSSGDSEDEEMAVAIATALELYNSRQSVKPNFIKINRVAGEIPVWGKMRIFENLRQAGA
jgi:hypothetical protein